MILLTFAYLGPDAVLPVTSALAGVAGFVLMFGRTTTAAFRRGLRRLRRIPRPTPPRREP